MKHAASASFTGISFGFAERWLRRFDAMFMTSPMLARRISGLGTPVGGGRMDGEKNPWPM